MQWGHVPACASRWAYAEPGWARIAALAPAVLRCAEEGDSVAFRIVTGAANEAVRAAVTVAERSRLKGHRFKMVLSGDSPRSSAIPRAPVLALRCTGPTRASMRA